ncbi:MAG TPA: signal recognition particle-docking protein FtsY [Chlamydiales bacterium]|nr:signal recognition particle-docking protein FtsY [Chlamydiales bacterium]
MFKTIASKFKKIFTSFRFSLGSKIKELFKRKKELDFSELEQLFFEADLGAAFSMELVEKLKIESKNHKEWPVSDILAFLKKELLTILGPAPTPTTLTHHPHVIMIVGVNGSGKTTSVAKLARYYKDQGKKVMLAACDTFRAAALEQLEIWAKKTGVELVRSQSKSDPSAVAFDAIQSAKAKNIDVVILDTAGRLHTKTDLMHELEKIKRVSQKQEPTAPHETLLVLDATTGQNALEQAEIFHQFTPITGIILTKLDGTAKGGIAVSIKKQKNLPILWVGLGEKEEDFAPFDPEAFVDALLETD